MSLVSTFVKSKDGLWYKNPVITDEKTYFICFDDEDPPEIVVAVSSKRQPEIILLELGIAFDNLRGNGKAIRFFNLTSQGFVARSFFFNILGNIPTPSRYDDSYKIRPDWH